MLPNPQTREEIPILPQEYQLTTNGDQFLVFDSGIGDPERIFIFTSDLGLQFLYESDQWYADGTFKVCLRYFTRFTLFMVNIAEESFHVFLDYCLIKPRRLTTFHSIVKPRKPKS